MSVTFCGGGNGACVRPCACFYCVVLVFIAKLLREASNHDALSFRVCMYICIYAYLSRLHKRFLCLCAYTHYACASTYSCSAYSLPRLWLHCLSPRSHINQRLSPSRNACLEKNKWCRERSNLLGLTNGAGFTMMNH